MFPSDFETKAVYSAVEGIRKDKRGSFKFPNFLFLSDISKLVDFLGRGREFAVLSFISFLFSLRVPSDSLLLRMDHRDDPNGEPVNQSDKTPIWAGSFMEADSLVLKMAWWEYLGGGCILKRTCVFDSTSSKPRATCPPHGILPLIRVRVQAVALCFPSYDKNNFDRRLESALREMEFKDARRYAPKAFRRGASQELLQYGPSIDVIKSAWAWLGAGFGSYIDLEFDKDRKISKIPTTHVIDGSPSEEDIEKPT